MADKSMWEKMLDGSWGSEGEARKLTPEETAERDRQTTRKANQGGYTPSQYDTSKAPGKRP
jgi:hypothetical protein